MAEHKSVETLHFGDLAAELGVEASIRVADVDVL
jgi:hypothetical protein